MRSFKIRGRAIDFKRALTLTLTGFSIGLIIFLKSGKVSSLLTAALFSGYILGVIGFMSENLRPLRASLASLILIIPVLVYALFLQTAVCNQHAIPGVDVGKNDLTGEVKVKTYIGDPDCADLLPQNYSDVKNDSLRQNKIEDYCDRNPGDKYCRFFDRETRPEVN